MQPSHRPQKSPGRSRLVTIFVLSCVFALLALGLGLAVNAAPVMRVAQENGRDETPVLVEALPADPTLTPFNASEPTIEQPLDPTAEPTLDPAAATHVPVLVEASTETPVPGATPEPTLVIEPSSETFTLPQPDGVQLLNAPQQIVADFSISQTSGVSTLTTTFTNATTPSGQAVNYSWNFGNGQTATTVGPHTITYPTPGTYTITLTADDTFSGGTVTRQVVVFAPGDVPVANFGFVIDPPNLATGTVQVCFNSAGSTGLIDTYQWYITNLPASGTPDLTQTAAGTICYQYPPGDYLASLVVIGADGRSSTRQELISIAPMPTLTPTNTATFTLTPTPSATFDTLACSTPPTNDALGSAIPVTNGSYTEGRIACATAEVPNATCGSGAAHYSVWYTYTTGAGAENFTANSFGSNYDTVLDILDATGTTSLACNDQFNGDQSQVIFELAANTTYTIRVSGWTSSVCDPASELSCFLSFQVSSTPISTCTLLPNDEYPGAFVVTSLPYDVRQTDTRCATANVTDPVISGITNRHTMWHTYTPVTTQDLIAHLEDDSSGGKSADYMLGVYTFDGTTFTLVTNDTQQVSFTATGGTQYYFFITARDGVTLGAVSYYDLLIVEDLVCGGLTNDEAAGATGILAGQTLNQISAQIECATTNPAPALDPQRTCGSLTAHNSVWYAFTPTNSQSYTVNTNGSSYDTVLTLHDSTLAETGCDDNGGSSDNSQLTFTGVAGTTYYIRVSAGSFFTCSSDDDSPPDDSLFPSRCALTIAMSPVIPPPSPTPFGSVRAAFTPSVYSGLSNTQVCFTDNSTFTPAGNTITSWAWDFGAGVTSPQQNPCVTFTTPGTFNVSLIVNTSFGLSARASNTVRVVQLSANNTVFVIQQPPTSVFTPSATHTPTATATPPPTAVPTTVPTDVLPVVLATNSPVTPTQTPRPPATPIPPSGSFINTPICGADLAGTGFPIIDLTPCTPDTGLPRPAGWQPPTPLTVDQCLPPIYHTNIDGGWELYRAGDLPGFPDAPANLSQGNDVLYSSISPALAPEGGLFVFTTDRDGNWELYIGSLDGRPPVRLTYNRTAADLDPEWSPLGDVIAFESTRDGNWNVYTIEVATGTERRITSNTASDLNATFSPDGTRLLFLSDRDGLWQVYEVELATGIETRISDGTADDYDPAYSPDGTQILYRSFRDGADGLSVLNTTTGVTTPITEAGIDAANAVWSADSRYIAYNSAGDDGDQDIYVYDTETQTTRQMTDNTADDVAPSWVCATTDIIFTSNQDGDNDLYQSNALAIDAPPVDPLTQSSRITNDPSQEQFAISQPSHEMASRGGRLPGGARNR